MLLSHPERMRGVALDGLTLLGGATSADSDLIHVITRSRHHVALDGVVCHRSGLLEEGDSIRRDGMRCTSPLRTVIDLSGPMTVGRTRQGGRRLPPPEAAWTWRSCGSGSIAPDRHQGVRLPRCVRYLPSGCPGYDPGESELEGRIARIIDAHGLPRPAQQHRVELWEAPLSDRFRLARAEAVPRRQRVRVAHAGDRSRRRRSPPERARARRLGPDRDHLANDRRRDREHHPPLPRSTPAAFVNCGAPLRGLRLQTSGAGFGWDACETAGPATGRAAPNVVAEGMRRYGE